MHSVRLTAFVDKLAHSSDMGRRSAAAAADDVGEIFADKRTHLPDHHIGRIIVGAELIRQTCIRVTADKARSRTRHLTKIWQHTRCSETAVETQRERTAMFYADHKRLDGLSRKSATRRVGDSHREHDLGHVFVIGKLLLRLDESRDGSLGIERIEDSLDKDSIDTALQ